MAKAHNKLQNTGILFELLVRQITSDTLSGKNSPAIDIIKKNFIKTELGKEYKLYETLFKKTQLNESRANVVLNTVLETSKKLDKKKLKKEKYNLVKDIKENYNLEEFFKTKLHNYKSHAAFHNLIELNSSDSFNPNEIISNTETILEHLTLKPKEKDQDSITEEYSNYDKDIRLLSYKIASEKFNEKYSDLNENQKSILKEYINSVDNTPKLLDFFNKKVNEVKGGITELNKKTKNEVSKIKINEVVNSIKEVKDKVKNDDIVNLMQYCDLLEELETVNK